VSQYALWDNRAISYLEILDNYIETLQSPLSVTLYPLFYLQLYLLTSKIVQLELGAVKFKSLLS